MPEDDNASGKQGLGRRLLAGTFNYGLGQVLPSVLSFMLLPVFASYLTPQNYGVIEIAVSLNAVVTILMRLGLPGAVTRFYFEYKDHPETLRDYLTTLTWVVMAGSILVAVLSGLVLWQFGTELTPGLVLIPHTALVLLAAILAGNSDIYRRLMQGREQSLQTLRLNLLTAVVTLGLSVTLVAGFRLGVVGYLLAEALGAGMLFLIAIFHMRADLTGRFRLGLLRESFVYALGVLPSHMAGMVAALASRSILSTASSLAAVGLYGIALRFARPLNVLLTAFNNAFLPIYFEQRRTGTPESGERLARVVGVVWSGSLLASLAVSLLGPPGVRLVTPTRFHEAAFLIPLMTLAFQCHVLYVLTSAEVYFAKFSAMVAGMAIVGNAVLVLGTWFLSEPLGAWGLALANIAYELTIALIALAYQRTSVALPLEWRKQVVPTLACAALYFAGAQLSPGAIVVDIAIGVVATAAFGAVLFLQDSPLVLMLKERRLKV